MCDLKKALDAQVCLNSSSTFVPSAHFSPSDYNYLDLKTNSRNQIVTIFSPIPLVGSLYVRNAFGNRENCISSLTHRSLYDGNNQNPLMLSIINSYLGWLAHINHLSLHWLQALCWKEKACLLLSNSTGNWKGVSRVTESNAVSGKLRSKRKVFGHRTDIQEKSMSTSQSE